MMPQHSITILGDHQRSPCLAGSSWLTTELKAQCQLTQLKFKGPFNRESPQIETWGNFHHHWLLVLKGFWICERVGWYNSA